MAICSVCNQQSHHSFEKNGTWYCKHCFGHIHSISNDPNLHNRFYMKGYGMTSQARINMISRRTQAEDGTVIDRRTGKESPNY